MRKYFEYPFNKEIKNKLIDHYNNLLLMQHSNKQDLKSDLKLKRILRLVNFNQKDKVLDIGCSRGYILKKISQSIKEGLGIDIAKKIIVKNNKNKIKNIRFELYGGENLNLNQKFDKILLIDVLEHSFNPDKLIKGVRKNISKKGKLIIQVPFTGFLSEKIFREYHEGHLRYYDPQYLKDYLKKFGFKIEKIKLYNSIPLNSKLIKFKSIFKVLDYLINLFPSKYFPYFGEILVVAERKK